LPFFANQGYHLRSVIIKEDKEGPLDEPTAAAYATKIQKLFNTLKTALEHIQLAMAKQYNKYRKEMTFAVGDKIWL